MKPYKASVRDRRWCNVFIEMQTANAFSSMGLQHAEGRQWNLGILKGAVGTPEYPLRIRRFQYLPLECLEADRHEVVWLQKVTCKTQLKHVSFGAPSLIKRQTRRSVLNDMVVSAHLDNSRGQENDLPDTAKQPTKSTHLTWSWPLEPSLCLIVFVGTTWKIFICT